ncbi:hypothetical protein LZC95_09380 [Pendulispora brunnea]|uniref:Uncharacterized protein n=1 Tax=Pendulispora brunnea TaxID=2905690 RepID=A0ABZ2KHJ0_9BACT
MDEEVVRRAATANPDAAPIRLFQESLPPGIRISQSTLEVEPGYKHQLLGKFAFSTGEEVSKDILITQVKRMCVTTGANAAIILFRLVPNEHQDRAQAIEAVLVNLQSTESERGATPVPGTSL